ncbi:MAG: AAA family ATPase [Muribaculaceae bacterium]|nr:AAA family ATPase [Muribaculaceae bacterium]
MILTGRESIEIKNFGPIKDITIWDLKKISVFIGESGSGKSTIMKVLAMMRWIYKMMCVRSYLKISGINSSPFRLNLGNILAKNGLKPFLHYNTRIHYSNGNFDIIIKNGKIDLPKKTVSKEELTIQKIAYISDKRVMIPDLAAGNVALRHNMFYLDETFLNFQKAIDAINSTELAYLGVKMNVVKTNGFRRVYVSGRENVDSFDNLPLTSASSGIQNSVALHFIMQYFAEHFNIVEAMNSTILKYLAETDNLSKFRASTDIGKFPNKIISVHLEEPELSLFPSNQWGLMKYLVKCCLECKEADMNLTLATHSPYIITALNIMSRAFRASGMAERDEINMPEINPSEIRAWEVREGEIRNILDEELQIIDGTYLDSISDNYEDLISHFNEIIYG